MMKKIIISFVALLFTVGVVPAQATTPNTIVIIDSGFNTSGFATNIVEEVCITTASGCNNGTGFQIGPGSAQTTVPIASRYVSDWNHGTLMAKAAVEINPNINLVLIRNANVYSNGNVLFGGESSLESALQWVLDNANTYNIVGVSMSRGSHTYVLNDGPTRKQLTYLQVYNKQLDKMGNDPKFRASIVKFTKMLSDAKAVMNTLPALSCPASSTVKTLVTQLATSNVATMFATGNDSNSRYVDSPACIDEAIAVAASANGQILSTSNIASNTDFAVDAPNTSIATARLAAKWSLMYNGSYNSTYGLLNSSGTKHHQTTIVP